MFYDEIRVSQRIHLVPFASSTPLVRRISRGVLCGADRSAFRISARIANHLRETIFFGERRKSALRDSSQRSLKLETILLTHHGYIKLSDFAFAKLLPPSSNSTSTIVGVPDTMPPEILLGSFFFVFSSIFFLVESPRSTVFVFG